MKNFIALPLDLRTTHYFKSKPDEAAFFYLAFKLIDIHSKSALANSYVHAIHEYSVFWPAVHGLFAKSYSKAIVRTYELLEFSLRFPQSPKINRIEHIEILIAFVDGAITQRQHISLKSRSGATHSNSTHSNSTHDYALLLWKEMLAALYWLSEIRFENQI